VRILCIDGGGMRGFIPLTLLRALSQEGSWKKLSQQFDLICGTSVGGLLALALGVLELDLDEVAPLFDQIGERVFGEKESEKPSILEKLKAIPSLLQHVWNGAPWYDAAKLEAVLRTVLDKKKTADAPLADQFKAGNARVFVTGVTSKGCKPVLFRNYENPPRYSDHTWADEEVLAKEATLLDAAMATCAAPVYFKPRNISRTNVQPLHVVDGGLLNNNPVLLAVTEAKRIWPHDDIELILSLGTGKAVTDPEDDVPAADSVRNMFAWGRVIVDITTDSERIHKQFLQMWRCLDNARPAIYCRLNPPRFGEKGLDFYNKKIIEDYRAGTLQYYYQDLPKHFKRTARRKDMILHRMSKESGLPDDKDEEMGAE